MKKASLALSIFLAVLFIFMSFPISVSSKTTASGTCGGALTWTLNDAGVLTVSGNGDMDDYSTAPWYGNRNLITSVIIEHGVTSIGSRAFYYCTNLTSIEIPKSVSKIGDCAFYSCSSLNSINIPGGVASIGSYAFWYCNSLTSLEIPSSVESIGRDAFWNCTDLTVINVAADNKAYCSIDGVLFNKTAASLIYYPAGNSRTSYTVPGSVTSIEKKSFFGCGSLTDIKIPSSVTSIGNSAFSNCVGLTDIKIPNGVTNIGSYAFGWCYDLKSIEIPNSVTVIGDFAFYNCTNLTEVYYYGTEEEWAAISIGFSEKLKNATIHFLGDVTADITFKASEDAAFFCNGEMISVDNVRLSVSDIPNDNELIALTDAAYDSYSAYEISLVDFNGNAVTLERGTVTLTLPFFDGVDGNYTLTLYHFTDDKTYEKSECWVNESGVLFTTDSLGSFVITALESTEPTAGVFVFKLKNTTAYYYDINTKYEIAVPAQFVDGRALVPLREVSTAAGITDLKYDAAAGNVTFTSFDGYTVEMTVGSTLCTLTKGDDYVEGSIVAPVFVDGVVMLPLRDTANFTGGTVKYDSAGYVVVSADKIADQDIAAYIAAYEAN